MRIVVMVYLLVSTSLLFSQVETFNKSIDFDMDAAIWAHLKMSHIKKAKLIIVKDSVYLVSH